MFMTKCLPALQDDSVKGTLEVNIYSQCLRDLGNTKVCLVFIGKINLNLDIK